MSDAAPIEGDDPREPIGDDAVPFELVEAGAPASLWAWTDEQRDAYFRGEAGELIEGDATPRLDVAAIDDDTGAQHGDVTNAGSTTWQVIERGAPAAAVYTSTANAVPAVDDWQTLGGAHGPAAITLRRWTRTWWPFADDVSVDFTIVLKFEYGAQYRGGGLFIPNLYVEVPQCFVGWRYDVDVDIAVGDADNANTPESPIARVPVAVRGVVFNDFWSDSVEWNLTLWGDGSWMRH